ncbi:MAG: hypothetical protein PHC50_04940, partial [Candidatus Cloacimonetes bacterium]|nr:hypothetical protein [Candidatus Cloacimonadota bacterium]
FIVETASCRLIVKATSCRYCYARRGVNAGKKFIPIPKLSADIDFTNCNALNPYISGVVISCCRVVCLFLDSLSVRQPSMIFIVQAFNVCML